MTHHTRLVPGFVTNTTLEPGVRVVTFGNSMVVREPIITVDEAAMRLVWSAEGGRATHYNASVQVFANPDNSSRIVWTSDFLPEAITDDINAAMSAGASVMKITLDKLA